MIHGRHSPVVARGGSGVGSSDESLDDSRRAAEDVPESAIRRAERLRGSRQLRSFSERTQDHIKRMTNRLVFHKHFVELLDLELVPQHVCKWIAWGKWHQTRAIRLALALMTRREANVRWPGRATHGWTYLFDHELGFAEKLFWETAEARDLVHRGVIVSAGAAPELGAFGLDDWAKRWEALLIVIRRMDAGTFRERVRRAAEAKRQRRQRKAKRVNLTASGAATIDALRTIMRGVLNGQITPMPLDELLGKEIAVRKHGPRHVHRDRETTHATTTARTTATRTKMTRSAR